jgi:hypothetical protein
MTIKDIELIKNSTLPKTKPVKEIMDIYIPNIEVENIPKRNGFIWVLSGSGGSGKSSLMLNLFRKRQMYKNKFHNIYYICPHSSFHSVKNHPFENHDKIYHELTPDFLYGLYNELEQKKKQALEEAEQEEEEPELEYSIVIIDDMANSLKDNEIVRALDKILIKARHLCCSFIFTLQQFKYFPLKLRSQITNITIFKTKNYKEWEDIAREMFNMNKDDSLILYNYIFNEPYAHLDVDTIQNKYYKNFNELIFIE